MATLAELVGQDDADRLAALKASLRAEAEQLEQAAAATPVQPVCKACGRRFDPPAVKFRDGTTGDQ